MNPPTDQPEDEKSNNLCAELTHLRDALTSSICAELTHIRDALTSSNRIREEWREKLFGTDGKSGLVAEAEGLRAQAVKLREALEEVQQNSSLEGFPEDAPDQVATIRGIVDRALYAALSKTFAQFDGCQKQGLINPVTVEVDDLSMLVRRLVRALRKHDPKNPLAEKAVEYLRCIGQSGSPLR
jgi:hypothetical protein